MTGERPRQGGARAGEVVVVGLGPGDPGLLTRAAWDHLAGEWPVFLRTRVHPTVDALVETLPGAAAWSSFDDLYERAPGFDALYDAIVAALLDAAGGGRGGIVYAVPGHPLVGESTVTRLRAAAPARGVAVRVVPGVSFVDAAATALGIDPLGENLQLVDGLELAAAGEAEPFGGGRWPLSPLRPALIGQVYGPRVVSAVKLALLRLYPAAGPATVLRAAGVAGAEELCVVPLHELDHRAPDHLTSIYLPALAPEAATRTAQGLQAIVARLRAPGGCPWDREQTHRSIRSNFLEETCEALDALDAGDLDAFREELGDVLLQVYLHAQLAEEAGEFALEDVYEAIASKLVRRHPHVFGDVDAADAGAVLRNWDRIKEAERRARGTPERTPSALDGVPRALPALARAALTQERIARLMPPAQCRTADDFAAALGRALAAPRDDGTDPSPDDATERDRFGAALFALAGLARARGVDPEEALDTAVAATAARFRAVEERLRAAGRDWPSLTPDEGAALWGEAASADRSTVAGP